MKKLISLILVIVLSLCLFTACDPDAEEIDWANIKLGHVLPEPQSNLMKIVSNDDDNLLVYIHKVSENDYLEYQRWCEKDKGFNIETESIGTSFYAYNQDGYYLSLYYSDSQDEMHITLDAPIPMEDFELPEYAVAAGLPIPSSSKGHFNWQNTDSFFLYVGETSKEDYMLYKDACVAAGFTGDPYEYNTVYSATNAEGYKVSLNYKGFNIFTLEFHGPDGSGGNSTEDNTSEYTLDYTDAESFESALNNGAKVKGKIVQFDVVEYKPDSAMGINCWSGEHLNFISENELDVVAGDVIIGYVSEEPSKVLGSWKIPYIVLAVNEVKTNATIPTDPVGTRPEVSTPPATSAPANTVGAPDDWTNLLEKHYEEVKKKFEDAGFTNITCVAHEIDFNENNVFEGSVVNIAVGEDGEICTFEKGEQWPADIKIRIDYRVKLADSETTAPSNEVVPLNECQIGDIVEFGSYPYLADGTKEPIRWLVLKVDGNKALLISCDILDAVQYHNKWEEITWENCALRKWLNDNFYNAAFSSSEKNQIVKVTNDNPDNNYSGFAPISGGYDTTDRVFVLCTEEVVEYFDIPVRGYHNPKTSYENMASEWTEYAKSQQDPSVEYGYTSWFTRSPGSTRKMVAIVSAGGYAFNAFGIEGHQGVRPVIWVELD